MNKNRERVINKNKEIIMEDNLERVIEKLKQINREAIEITTINSQTASVIVDYEKLKRNFQSIKYTVFKKSGETSLIEIYYDLVLHNLKAAQPSIARGKIFQVNIVDNIPAIIEYEEDEIVNLDSTEKDRLSHPVVENSNVVSEIELEKYKKLFPEIYEQIKN